jgi:spore coat polysaccharide biosynthesis predicted glycosyltransferase SpsG
MARRRKNFPRGLKVLIRTAVMKIVFRVDASGEVGFGHLSRCVNLAEVLRRRGNEVSFVCRDDEAKSFNFLEKRLLKALPLASNTASSKISQETEDDETIDALDGVRHSWLIVDGYKLDGKFEEKLRRYVKKIAATEDLADRKHN